MIGLRAEKPCGIGHPRPQKKGGNIPAIRFRSVERILFGIVLSVTLSVFSYLSPAGAHSACSVYPASNVGPNGQVWFGDEHANNCDGGTYNDDMYGEGSGDHLYGGGGADDLMGATGDDGLHDRAPGDFDDMCDGSGRDTLEMDDTDGYDVAYMVQGDGPDVVRADGGDYKFYYSANNCPLPN